MWYSRNWKRSLQTLIRLFRSTEVEMEEYTVIRGDFQTLPMPINPNTKQEIPIITVGEIKSEGEGIIKEGFLFWNNGKKEKVLDELFPMIKGGMYIQRCLLVSGDHWRQRHVFFLCKDDPQNHPRALI